MSYVRLFIVLVLFHVFGREWDAWLADRALAADLSWLYRKVQPDRDGVLHPHVYPNIIHRHDNTGRGPLVTHSHDYEHEAGNLTVVPL